MPAPDDLTPGGVTPRAGDATTASPRVLLLVAALLLVARVIAGIYEAQHPRMPLRTAKSAEGAGPNAPAESVDFVKWRSIEAAETEARTTHRPLLYEFGAAWCGPCRLMQREMFANASVAGRLNGTFVPVSVVDRSREDGANASGVAALEARFGITAFPTLVVVREDGAFEKIEGYGGVDRTMSRLLAAAVGPRGEFFRRNLLRALPGADSTRGARH